MAFTEEFHLPQRWSHFHFYTSGKANGAGTESISIGRLWKLQEIRLHFSTAFASVEDLVVRLSAVNGSYFNTLFLSQALNAVQDLWVHYSDPLLFFSDDQLKLTFSMKSNINGWGLEVIGWAVQG